MKIIMLPKFKRIKQYCMLGTAVFLFLGFVCANLPHQEDNAKKQVPIEQGRTDSPKVAFACNVFWGEEFLPDMLKTLDDNNVKITFFIGGTWAKSNPELLKTMADKGHELANHSYNHPHPNSLSKEQNQEQILKTEKVVEDITGIKTALYAPPYGEYNDIVLKAASEINYPTVMWTVDTIDWKRPPAEIIKNRVLKKAANGAIVLMHPTDPTSKALPELIKSLQEQGYTITTVSDVL